MEPQPYLLLDLSIYARKIFAQIRFFNTYNPRIITTAVNTFKSTEYCKYCNLPGDENFHHFIIDCTIYGDLKKKFFGDEMFDVSKLMVILNCADKSKMCNFINYVKEALELRAKFFD